MRLVNRTFNEAIEALLFEHVLVNDCERLEALAETTITRHIQTLNVYSILPEQNEGLRTLFRKMPQLTAFHSDRWLEAETISVLHQSCPKLAAIAIYFEKQGPPRRRHRCRICPSSAGSTS